MSRPKNKEEDILEGALKVFMEKGLGNSSIQDIANNAGIGKGTIYEYFKSKDELFVQTIKFHISQKLSQLKERISCRNSFEDKLDEMINLTQEATAERSRWNKLFIINEFVSLPSEFRDEFNSYFSSSKRKVLEIFSEVLMQGIAEGKVRELDLEFTSNILWNLINIRSTTGCTFSDNSDRLMVEERAKLKEFIVNGIGNNKKKLLVST